MVEIGSDVVESEDKSERGLVTTLRKAIDRAERAEAEATRLRTMVTSYEVELRERPRPGDSAGRSLFAKIGTSFTMLTQQVERIAEYHHTRDFSVAIEGATEIDAIGRDDLLHYVVVVRINHRQIARSAAASRDIGEAIRLAKLALDRAEKDYIGELYLSGAQFKLLMELVKWEEQNPGLKMMVSTLDQWQREVAETLLSKGLIIRWSGDDVWHVELTPRAQFFLAGR